MTKGRITINVPAELGEVIEQYARKKNTGYATVCVLALAQHFHVELPEDCFKPGPRGPRLTPNKPPEVVAPKTIRARRAKAAGDDYAF